jgi:ribosomal protein L30/L7E
MASVGHDFYAWIVENIKYNKRMMLTEVFNTFTDDYPVYRKYSQKWTSLRLKKYGDYLERKGKINKVVRGKLNDVTPYIEFIKL